MFTSEWKWIVPFVLLGTIALIVARPEPKAPLPSGQRTVVDSRGKQVHIALPFRGSVITRAQRSPATWPIHASRTL